MFKNIDLSTLSSVVYKVDPSQIGGSLSLHVDKSDGKELSIVEVGQVERSQKIGADQKDNKWKEVSGKLIPQKGVHDIYIVYHDPENAQSSMWTTLFLDWIEFRK